jgi:hypothetical protein
MPVRTRTMFITATSRLTSHIEADHGCPGIELTHPLAGKSLHQRGWRGQEGVSCQAGGRCRHSRQEHLPLGGFKLQASSLAFRLDNVDHVNPVRQGRV